MIKKLFSFGTGEFKSHRRLIEQASWLFSAQIFILLIGILSKGIQTRVLGPADYGVLAFFASITSFTILFFNFGFLDSVQVLLANTNNLKKERKLFGAGLWIALIIGLCYALFIFIISFFIDSVFRTNIGLILRVISPFCLILLVDPVLHCFAKGSNKIKEYSVFVMGERFLYIVILLILFFLGRVTVLSILLIQLVAILTVFVYIIKKFKPSFKGLSRVRKEIFKKNKTYGIHIFIGSIFNQTSYKLDGLFITYFIDTTRLGFYSLASTICSPMVNLSSAVAQSLFKKFAEKDRIPKKLFIYNTIWLLFCVIFLVITGKYIVYYLFGNKFLPLAKYIVPMSIVYFFQGMYQPFFFLSTKSLGKELRNISFIEGAINIIGNVTMIPLFGVMGAIYVSILARMVDFIGLSYYYRRWRRNIKQ